MAGGASFEPFTEEERRRLRKYLKLGTAQTMLRAPIYRRSIRGSGGIKNILPNLRLSAYAGPRRLQIILFLYS
jgi:hypothetical protein